MFLLSKSIELLVLSAESYSYSENKKEVFLKNKSDKEKIIAVRDLINENLNCPPNLNQIAKTIGLNEYKLNSGKNFVNYTQTFENQSERIITFQQNVLSPSNQTLTNIQNLYRKTNLQRMLE